MKYLGALCVLLAFTQASAESDLTIRWIVSDIPPFITFPEGRDEIKLKDAKGSLIESHKKLEELLPQYTHQYVVQSVPRAEQSYKDKKGFCSLILRYNKPREEYINFGASVVTIGVKVGIILSPNSKYFSSAKKLADESGFEKLLRQDQFKIAVHNGRSYGTELDRIIKDNASKKTFFNQSSRTASIFSLVESDRVQATLAFKHELANYKRSHKSDLQYFDLKESDSEEIGYASCDKSEQGEKTLKDISEALRSANYRKFSNDVLVPLIRSYEK